MVSGSGTTYNVAVSGMTGNGTVSVAVPASAVHDAPAIPMRRRAAASVTYNATPPSVTVAAASGQTSPTAASPINFTVTFSEAVTGFTGSGVTLSGGTATGTLSRYGDTSGTAGTTYNVAVSGMTGPGTVTATIDAGKVHDAAGNANMAATAPATVTYSPLSVTVSQASWADRYHQSLADRLHRHLQRAGDRFHLRQRRGPQRQHGHWHARRHGHAGRHGQHDLHRRRQRHDRHGTVVASIDAGKVHDAGGNPNVASTSTGNTVTYEAAPTVTIVPATGQAAATGGSPIDFTVTFSEPVTDFTSGSDVDLNASTVTGTLAPTITPVGTDGTTYTVAVSGMTGIGTVAATSTPAWSTTPPATPTWLPPPPPASPTAP